MIDWENVEAWGNHVHEASNGSWIDAEERAEQ